MAGATFFSKTDMKEAYQQLELSENCRYLTNFHTEKGIIRFKHLCYDINNSFVIFQKAIHQSLRIMSKKTAILWQWHRFIGFIVNFEHISHLRSSVSIVNFEHVIDGWVVPPQSLRKKTIEIVHQGHLGICQVKSLLREKVCWPRLDADVNEFISQCIPFQANSRIPPPKPVKISTLPGKVFEEICVDY